MMVKLFVWSVLLYAFETWCLTAEDILRLQAIKNVDMAKNIQKIKWTDRVSHEGGVTESW